MGESMGRLGEAIQHVMVAAKEGAHSEEDITLLVHNRFARACVCKHGCLSVCLCLCVCVSLCLSLSRPLSVSLF